LATPRRELAFPEPGWVSPRAPRRTLPDRLVGLPRPPVGRATSGAGNSRPRRTDSHLGDPRVVPAARGRGLTTTGLDHGPPLSSSSRPTDAWRRGPPGWGAVGLLSRSFSPPGTGRGHRALGNPRRVVRALLAPVAKTAPVRHRPGPSRNDTPRHEMPHRPQPSARARFPACLPLGFLLSCVSPALGFSLVALRLASLSLPPRGVAASPALPKRRCFVAATRRRGQAAPRLRPIAKMHARWGWRMAHRPLAP
jgi:hypothetical protein